VVYRARATALDRQVAVKICAGMGANQLERLQREAVALARLSHPNVVRVHEVSESHGILFIAMEYLSGGTGSTWLSRAPRSVDDIVAFYREAGVGLAAAHAAGLVHRDFK